MRAVSFSLELHQVFLDSTYGTRCEDEKDLAVGAVTSLSPHSSMNLVSNRPVCLLIES
jgi:hypothetical protein